MPTMVRALVEVSSDTQREVTDFTKMYLSLSVQVPKWT